MEPKGGTEQGEQDAADYLFQTNKYHDRQITVGDPETGPVEIFGVSISHLVSQSTVFREMLAESDLADLTGKNTHIKDVSPKVFTLMLRHVYGGKFPRMSRNTATELAVCADKYNIQPLVEKAAALQVPTSFKDVFPALRCVAYISAPNLEKHVVAIIQKYTDKVIAQKEFLTLDGNCLEFIAKQDPLAISELELWKGLLKWAKRQTDDPTEMRALLVKPLRHVRFLTLSHDEVIKGVMPSNVLTPEETMDLLSAIGNQLTLKSSQLSSTKQFRSQTMPKIQKRSRTFDVRLDEDDALAKYQSTSNFTVKPLSKDVVILSFTCRTRAMSLVTNNAPYTFNCKISIYTYLDGFLQETNLIEINGSVQSNEELILPMKLDNGTYMHLKHSFSYTFCLEFSSGHPVFTLPDDDMEDEMKDENGLIHVQYHTPFHILKIDFEC